MSTPTAPAFSVLLPSRNRLELLQHAVESVRRQRFDDWQIVISDNASEPGYAEFVRSLDDPRIILVGSDVPLSVTDNWNRSLESATGRYVVMLGDDDALAPGYFEAQAALIEQFADPEVVYSAAYHYAYPNVVPGEPRGYFAAMDNSRLFRRDDGLPYLVDVPTAREMGHLALRFRHEVSFNAQHFLYRRSFVDRLKRFGPIYQSPYPDYYCCFMTFLQAQRLVVDPRPRIIIGISSHSFGFFFLNNRAQEGAAQFLADAVDTQALAGTQAQTAKALLLPGSDHTRNWLIAALLAQRRLAQDHQSVRVDLRRYARIQIFEIAQKAAYDRSVSHRDFWVALRAFGAAGDRFGRRIYRLFLTMDRIKTLQRPLVSWGIRELLGQYLGPRVTRYDVGPHASVLDVIEWLERGVLNTPVDAGAGGAEEEAPAAASIDAPADEAAATAPASTPVLVPASRSSSRLQAFSRNKRVLLRILTRPMRRARLADFDADWYAETYPDVRASGARPLVHFLHFGLREGRAPNAYAARFDRQWYLGHYPDVAQAGVDPLEHFLGMGAAEGRVPRAELQTFDPQWYAQTYPDVVAAGQIPVLHYLRFGLREGRQPNPYASQFDSAWYLASYPDIAAAGVDPLTHFLRAGAHEGRLPNAALQAFDAAWYATSYADVDLAKEPPLLHYMRSGGAQGRPANPLAASVDAAWYLRQYPDVATSGMSSERHFVAFGAREGRVPSERLQFFDADWYGQTYPDVVASGQVPLQHFLTSGRKEGRAANSFLRDFDPAWYAKANPDVVAAGLDPLEHFVTQGAAEGRAPNANPRYFDAKWYVATYPDVEPSGLVPMLHFLRIGARAGYAPNAAAAQFDAGFYLATYPDVVAAGADPLRHYLLRGMVEGRHPNAVFRQLRPAEETAGSLLRTGALGAAAVLNLWLDASTQAADKFLPFKPISVVVDTSRGTAAKLQILLPSVRKQHATGGPNTAFLLGVFLARQGIRVAFVSTALPPDEDPAPMSDHLLTLTGFRPEAFGITFDDASDPDNPLRLSPNDVFMATAWWTAQAAMAVLPQTRRGRFYYLIQDFEPLLHPASENWCQAVETYQSDHVPVINTSLLLDYLRDQAIGRYAVRAFADRALVFEPAVDRKLFHAGPRQRRQPRRLLFYARPTIAQRNLFGMGVAALKAAVTAGLFGEGGWEFLGIGESFAAVPLGRGMSLVPAPWQNLEGYCAQMRGADILLSLMLSPHPSYPPLEMAACGGCVVTTEYGSKTAQRLAALSPRIIGVTPSVEALVWGLQRAVRCSDDGSAVQADIGLPASWEESMAAVIPGLLAELARDGIVPADPALALPPAQTSTALALTGGHGAFYRARERVCSALYRPTETCGLISLVTTVYDTSPDQLADLAHSVFAQDAETDFEWVLLDNGSSRPETLAMLERLRADPRVRFRRVEANLGIIRGMRWCLEQAQGRYVVPVDSDDLLFPHALRVMAAFIEQCGFPALLYTDEDKTDGRVQLQLYAKPDWDPVLFVHSCFIAHLTALDRVKALALECYSDSAADGSHDWDSFVRFVGAGYVPVHLAEPLYTWRMHSGSTSANYRSKDYIYRSQQFVLQNFLRFRGLADQFTVEPSALFGGTPDWRFLPRKRGAGTWLASLVIATAPEDGTLTTANVAMLEALPKTVTHVHLTSNDCEVVETDWADEVTALMMLFPDAVMVGGRIHDGTVVREAGYVWGYGGVVGCPDVGRAVADPGYFAQMWKPRSVGAVSVRHCVVRRDFLRTALGELGAEVTLTTLGPWLGAIARERGERVVYSPYIEARCAPWAAAPPATQDLKALAMRFGHLAGDRTGYSPRLDRSGNAAYVPGDGEAARTLPAYADFLRSHVARRRARRGPSAPAGLISILTTVYQKTDADLFRQTAGCVAAQDLSAREWLVLAHGPVSAELDAVLDELVGSGVIRLLRLETNLGIAGGMRHCLEAAAAPFVLPLDADDILEPDAIATLSEAIGADQQAQILYSDEDLLIGGAPRHPYARPDFDPALLCAHSYVWHAIAFRRETGLALGVFTNSGAEYAQDWDVLLRFMQAGHEALHLPKVLYHWRQHEHSLSHSGQVFEGSLSSIRHLLGDVARGSGNPGRYEVQPYPHRVGEIDYYLRRRPVEAPAVLRIDLGGRAGRPACHAAAAEFDFAFVVTLTMGRGRAALEALVSALADSDAELVLLLGGGVTLMDDVGIWQAVKQLELLPRALAVGGPLVDAGGIVRSGAIVEMPDGTLVDPVRNRPLVDAGAFSLALKPHCVTMLPPDLMLGRRAVLLDALRDAPPEVTARSLGAWLGVYTRRHALRLVYEPLFCAGIDRARLQVGDPLEGLQHAWGWLSAAQGVRPRPLQGLAGFAWHAMHHG